MSTIRNILSSNSRETLNNIARQRKRVEWALKILRDDLQKNIDQHGQNEYNRLRTDAINLLIDDHNHEKEWATSELAWIQHEVINEGSEIISKLLLICYIHGITRGTISDMLRWPIDDLEKELKNCELQPHYEITDTYLIEYHRKAFRVPLALRSYETSVKEAKARGPVKVTMQRPPAFKEAQNPGNDDPFSSTNPLDELPF